METALRYSQERIGYFLSCSMTSCSRAAAQDGTALWVLIGHWGMNEWRSYSRTPLQTCRALIQSSITVEQIQAVGRVSLVHCGVLTPGNTVAALCVKYLLSVTVMAIFFYQTGATQKTSEGKMNHTNFPMTSRAATPLVVKPSFDDFFLNTGR